MHKKIQIFLLATCAALFVAPAQSQSSTGALDITAQVTPTGGRPEPVRQFPLFILTKSYDEIVKEVEAQDPLPTQAEFIDLLKCSPQLKTWMKDHATIDLAQVDFDKMLTPDDIMKVPEFLAAYQRANSGGVTAGLPTAKFKESDKETNPEKYAKAKEDYLIALKKFIQGHLSTVSGIELELAAANPKSQWDRIREDRKKRVAQLAPDIAQSKYLVAHVETDLDGRASVSGLVPASYWISSLGVDASSGDRRFHWDSPAIVRPGQTAYVTLSNVNGIDVSRSTH